MQPALSASVYSPLAFRIGKIILPLVIMTWPSLTTPPPAGTRTRTPSTHTHTHTGIPTTPTAHRHVPRCNCHDLDLAEAIHQQPNHTAHARCVCLHLPRRWLHRVRVFVDPVSLPCVGGTPLPARATIPPTQDTTNGSTAIVGIACLPPQPPKEPQFFVFFLSHCHPLLLTQVGRLPCCLPCVARVATRNRCQRGVPSHAHTLPSPPPILPLHSSRPLCFYAFASLNNFKRQPTGIRAIPPTRVVFSTSQASHHHCRHVPGRVAFHMTKLKCSYTPTSQNRREGKNCSCDMFIAHLHCLRLLLTLSNPPFAHLQSCSNRVPSMGSPGSMLKLTGPANVHGTATTPTTPPPPRCAARTPTSSAVFSRVYNRGLLPCDDMHTNNATLFDEPLSTTTLLFVAIAARLKTLIGGASDA